MVGFLLDGSGGHGSSTSHGTLPGEMDVTGTVTEEDVSAELADPEYDYSLGF